MSICTLAFAKPVAALRKSVRISISDGSFGASGEPIPSGILSYVCVLFFQNGVSRSAGVMSAKIRMKNVRIGDRLSVRFVGRSGHKTKE